MQTLKIKLDDITGEKISALVNFLDNPWTWVNPKMAMLYGRFWMRLNNELKTLGMRIDDDIIHTNMR